MRFTAFGLADEAISMGRCHPKVPFCLYMLGFLVIEYQGGKKEHAHIFRIILKLRFLAFIEVNCLHRVTVKGDDSIAAS